MVVMVHSLVCWKTEIFTQQAKGMIEALLILVSGRAPVILFFVLSGFVLASSLRKQPMSMVNISAYFVRRLFRLVPAAYCGLVLALVIFFVVREFFDLDHSLLYLKDWIGAHYAASLADLPINMEFASNSINPVYWTLHVEVMGSVLMPVIVLALQSRKKILIAGMIMILLMLPFFPHKFTSLGGATNALIFCFALGALSFYLLSESSVRSVLTGYMGIAGCLVLLFAHKLVGENSIFGGLLGTSHYLIPVLGSGDNVGMLLQHYLEALGATVLVAYLAIHGNKVLILMSRPAVFLGKISYSLYVIHFSILALVVAVLGAMGYVGASGQSIWLPVVTFVTVMAISVPLAFLSHRFIEIAGMNLGHRYSKSIQQRWGR